LTAAEDTEWKGLILAGLYLGQRLGDIARLRWTHIDFELAEVSIFSEKTGGAQIIPIAAPLLRFITEELPVHDPAASLSFLADARSRFEPTGGLWRKSTVYGLNGHRAYYIISLFKVTYKSTIQISRNFNALFTETLENSDTCD
jgi:integrase